MQPDWARENFEDRERLIYHYTTWETLLRYILPSQTLRIGPFGGTNDVTDFSLWPATGWVEGKLEEDHRFAFEFLSLIWKRSNLLSFSSDHEGHMDDFFQRGMGKLPMWGHYARSFTGVCLVLERGLLLESVRDAISEREKLLFHGYVDYELPKIPDFSIPETAGKPSTEARALAIVEANYRKYFFAKHESWRYENEYRVVAVLTDDREAYVRIENALVGVVLGEQCPFIDDAIKGYRDKKGYGYKFDILKQSVSAEVQDFDLR